MSFRTKDIDIFESDYSDPFAQDKTDMLKTIMDKFDENFDKIKIPVTSIPMILYSGYRILKDEKSFTFTKLIDIINEFLRGYENNEEYK